MKEKYLSILIAGLILFGIYGTAQSDIVTSTFSGTVTDGPFAGYFGTGSFTYDDALVSLSEDWIIVDDGLEVSFSFDGQTFNETNDEAYPDFPQLVFYDYEPSYLDYVIVGGENGVVFNNPTLAALGLGSLSPADRAGEFDFNTEIFAEAVPIPNALWLFGSGIVFLIGFGRKKIFKG
jgi:hypothetical protein